MTGVGLVLAVLFVLPGELAAKPAYSDYQPLVVRTFDRFGISTEDLRTVRAGVSVILKAAGIEVSWLDCWQVDREPAGATPRCRQPVGPNEVILRIQSASPLPGARLVPMGVSLVNCQDEAPHLSTVYADQVAAVADRAGIDSRVLLARVIAHELGHLLLDTTRHATRGLMRAVWSQSELRRNDSHDWVFRKDEARVMRAAIASRMTLAN